MKLSLRFNAILRIIHTAINIIIPIVVGPYVIKTLSKTSYDKYTKANVEVQLFLLLASVSIFTYGIRTISKIRENKEEAKKVFSEIFIYNIIITVIFFGLYCLYIYLFNNYSSDIIYFILSFQFIGSLITVEWFIEALENYKFITFKSIILKALYVISIFLFLREDNVLFYTIIISLTYIFDNLISFVYVIKKYGIKLKGLNLKKHLKKVVLVFLISNISLLYMQADKIMLGLMISDNAVTSYTIPSYIVTSIYNVIISIFVVAVPRLNNYYQNKSKEDFIKLYNEVIKTFFLIFIPILTFTFVLSEEIITFYTSSKYLESIILLKYFCLVIFLNATTYLQREGILYVFEKEKTIIKINLIGGIINILSNTILYFLKIFTPKTAIITLGISFLFLTIMMRINVRKMISKKIILIDRSIVMYFFISLLVVIINYIFGFVISNLLLKLIIVFGSFGLVYLILLIMIKDEIFLINYKILKNYLAKLHKSKV